MRRGDLDETRRDETRRDNIRTTSRLGDRIRCRLAKGGDASARSLTLYQSLIINDESTS